MPEKLEKISHVDDMKFTVWKWQLACIKKTYFIIYPLFDPTIPRFTDSISNAKTLNNVIRKSGRPWYDRAEFISTELFGSLCSDIIKEYSVV